MVPWVGLQCGTVVYPDHTHLPLILIRWLRRNPADRDLLCFHKRINLGSAGQKLDDSKNKIKVHQSDMVQCRYLDIGCLP